MKKKSMQRMSKTVLALLFFIGGTIAVLLFTMALHMLLNGKTEGIEIFTLGESIASLLVNQKHRILFGCLELLVVLVSIGVLLINTKTYQAEVTQITESIATPVTVGQNQHGSAKWLKPKLFDRVFAHFTVRPQDALIRKLADHGEDDFRELRRIEKLWPMKEAAINRFLEAVAALKKDDYLPEDWRTIEHLKKHCKEEVTYIIDPGDAERYIESVKKEIRMVCTLEAFAEKRKESVRRLEQYFAQFKDMESFHKWQMLQRLKNEGCIRLMETENSGELEEIEEKFRKMAKEAAVYEANLDAKKRAFLKKEKQKMAYAFDAKRAAIKKASYDEESWRQLLGIRDQFYVYVENATTTRELDDICRYTDACLRRVKTIAMKEQGGDLDLMDSEEEIEWVESSFLPLLVTARQSIPEDSPDGSKPERGYEMVENKIAAIAERSYLEKGGLVIGMEEESKKGEEKFYFIDDDLHSLCIGATRCGKSRHLVLQSIGALGLAGESMILSDPKGELFQYTKPFLERLGYEVKVIDFKNPNKSDRYNFLQPVVDELKKGDEPKAVNAVWDITRALVPDESHGEKIWQHGEASVIASSIMSVAFDNQEPDNARYQNMTNVYHFISEMVKPINKTSPMAQYIREIPETHPARSLLSIADIAPDRTKGSFYTGALTNLRLFTTEYIYNMTKTSDYNPRDLGVKKMALFIVLPDATTTYYPLASLLVSQHYMALTNLADEMGGRLPVRVNFILDEFGNFTKIDDFPAKLTVGGGRGIRFNLFLQAISQLESKYGEEDSRTIMGNCHTWIYLLSKDQGTNETISGKLGKYTTSAYSLSSQTQKYAAPSASQSINLIERPLLTPDEVGKITRPHSLVLAQTDPAMMYAPDVSQQLFNRMYGLGDIDHNKELRLLREKYRRGPHKQGEIALWGIWHKYIALCRERGGM